MCGRISHQVESAEASLESHLKPHLAHVLEHTAGGEVGGLPQQAEERGVLLQSSRSCHLENELDRRTPKDFRGETTEVSLHLRRDGGGGRGGNGGEVISMATRRSADTKTSRVTP